MSPQLRDRDLLDDVWFQQDGAPAHFALSVRNILNKHFPGRWIGRSSPALPAPLTWPPRSPDLSTPDNSLCGIIKDQVSARRYYSSDDLRRAVKDAFTLVQPSHQNCFNECLTELGGASNCVLNIMVTTLIFLMSNDYAIFQSLMNE
jgi:hypothetical protein